ncbi:type II toxin-antitoxin system RelE/ParE family toxin [Aeoliella mucimassa]|uniref:Plasmid stabilization system protein n=1 Tax=Aeoliella mucimassa TaxID=2527972 RepID=A0A518AL22_9BACT|nr:type II toxin-antitoxin system RelE/ParE family toxin [Aeoliella mucimassa]QDU55435.1 Plasmid stabilization system protein [Aeoliella mucimassa]
MADFRVLITDRASAQLHEIVEWIEQRAPETAQRWFKKTLTEITSLSIMPRRHSLARESIQLKMELREILVGKRKWRVLYTIRDQDVIVMCIRIGALGPVTAEDLSGD